MKHFQLPIEEEGEEEGAGRERSCQMSIERVFYQGANSPVLTASFSL